MNAPPVRPASIVYRLARSYIEPAENEKMMREIEKEHREQYEDQLREDLRRGLGPLRAMETPERRAMFMGVTDLLDVGVLIVGRPLQPGELNYVMAGLALGGAPIEADRLIEMYRQGQISFVSPWWVAAFGLRDMLVKHLLRLFRDALRRQLDVTVGEQESIRV